MGVLERKLQRNQIEDSFVGWLDARKAEMKDVGCQGESSPGSEGAGLQKEHKVLWHLTGGIHQTKNYYLAPYVLLVGGTEDCQASSKTKYVYQYLKY